MSRRLMQSSETLIQTLIQKQSTNQYRHSDKVFQKYLTALQNVRYSVGERYLSVRAYNYFQLFFLSPSQPLLA